MKKTVIVFGLLSGVILSVWLVCSIAWCYGKGNFEGSMLLGYASMFVAFSLVFVGVKKYRDQYNRGIISFGKAFRTGLYIALFASTMYVVTWLVDYYVFIPDFIDKYSASVLSKAQSSGADAGEIAAKLKEIDMMKAMYRTPLMVVLFTYLEVFPVGLIVSVLTAWIVKRNTNGNRKIQLD